MIKWIIFDGGEDPRQSYFLFRIGPRTKVESQPPVQAKLEDKKMKEKLKCLTCGHSFASQRTLALHRKYGHSTDAIKCFCGKAFSWPVSHRRHMLSHHPELDPSDPSLSERVQKTDLPEAQQRLMQNMKNTRKKGKFYQQKK